MTLGTHSRSASISSLDSITEETPALGPSGTRQKPTSHAFGIDQQHTLLRDDIVTDAGAIEDRAMNPMIFALIILTSFCGFLFGYDTGYISGALIVIKEDLGHVLSSTDKELITSATSVGALVFALVGGPLADWIGRKWVISGANTLFILGAIIQTTSHSLWSMVAGRFIMGWGVGLASLVAPLYISELAPSRFRGRLIVVNVLAITGGQLVAYTISAALSDVTNGWRILVGISIIPAAVQMVLFIFMPESPRYLVSQGRVNEARRVLERTYQNSKPTEIEDKLLLLKEHNILYASNSDSSWLKQWAKSYVEVHKVPSNLRAVIITCGLQGIQQFSGFNALMYFSATIFEMLGFRNPIAVSILIAGTNFVFTLVAFACIDRIGRRRILLYSIWGMIVALSLASVAFYHLDIDMDAATINQGTWSIIVIVAMLAYVASYACGIGNVPWQQAEMFPMKVRGVGTSLATATNWTGSLIISFTFLTMLKQITPAGTFAFYAGLCFCGEMFVYFFYPETANCTLEEVQSLLTGGFNIKESVQRNETRRVRYMQADSDDEDEGIFERTV